MTLTDSVKKFIIDHARECKPLECAGLILQKGEPEARRLENFSANAKYHCFIKRDEVDRVAEGNEILAIYHSHFESEDFSLEDKAVSERCRIKLVLYCLANNSFKIYEPNGFIAPYIGRPWRQGVFTCIELLEDYYRKELNIIIKGWENERLPVDPVDEKHFPTLRLKDLDFLAIYKEIPSNEVYQKYSKLLATNQIYIDFLLRGGFKPVKDLKKHDILLTVDASTERAGFASHGWIFLGEDRVLHHSYGRASVIEKFNNNAKLALRYILRHETLL